MNRTRAVSYTHLDVYKRQDKRRANWKLTVPGLVEYPQCHAMVLPHHVCPICGFYKGKSVIQAKTEG